ncbi:hypothetical protein [Peptococcus niger]|uniref:Uncharacterized protein n=1 Tax=Peptococcus niger TaxID=2741 RepID=A0A1G6RN95_PEPNI|nr:hypothetical protein [Peptococcus niger]SDD06132.1 hypothetical protein SAMN04489866_10175 [Peptococcus niger]
MQDSTEKQTETLETQETEQKQEEQAIEHQEQSSTEPDMKPAEKTFTQAEVDAIVQKRLAREKSKEADHEDNETKESLAALQKDMRAMQAENYALKKGISEDRIGYVIKLAETVEADTVQERIDKVLEDFPVLTVKPEEDDGMAAVRASVSKSKPQKAKMTRAEIAAIKDPAERRRAIADNIALYTND